MAKNVLRAVIFILSVTAIYMMCRDLVYRYGMRNTPYYRYTFKTKDSKVFYMNSEEFIPNDSLTVLEKQPINRP